MDSISEASRDSSIYISDMDAETRYIGELKGLYARLTATQTSDHDVQWPPPCTHKVFNLAMIQEETVMRSTVTDFEVYVQMTITGKLDDILHVKTPVELGNIFSGVRQNKRKVVLMEGAPGCGKSTLTNYISQQWGEGKIFAEFKFKAVILVRLRDPVIQKAESIVDLFPSGDDSIVARKAMESMRASKFEDVLFIIDGWDELPAHLRDLQNDSIFRRLIQDDEAEKHGLEKSAVIVTSRPVASGNLHKIISARVEILGFTPEELHNYFRECLGGDSEAVKTLLERIEENPEISGTCYLPLNATVLVHLFKHCESSDLPTSQYGVFSLLVCTCISRHFKNRTEYKSLSLKTLDQLVDTDVVKQPFQLLCDLAYKGVMSDEITFSSLPDDTDTLSILHGVESFVKHDDKVKSYNFIHLSIQELLAAFYIKKWLSPKEQVDKFKELVGNPRFNAVFHFYSAMTKLKTPGISDILTKVAEQCSSPSPEDDIKVLLVALFHCLHAAQEPRLCELVMKRLKHGLNLGHNTLNPTDCLCVGYFLSCVCSIPTDTSEFKARLFNCDMGDKGIKYLVRGLQKRPTESGLQKGPTESGHTVTRLYMDLKWSNLKEKGSMELSKLLQCDCVGGMNLNGNDDFSDPGTFHIAEKLRTNTSLTELQLYTCGITSEGAGYVAKALAINNSLEILNLGGNKIEDEGVTHLASALRVNRRLKSLELSSCGMTDKGLKHITDSLQHNESLEELKLYNFQNQKQLNDITVNGPAMDGLFYTIGKTSTLRSLLLPKEFESHLSDLLESVTEDRKFYSQTGEIKIEVKGQTVKAIMGIEESDDEEMEEEEEQHDEIDRSDVPESIDGRSKSPESVEESGMEEDSETMLSLSEELHEEETKTSMYFAQLEGFRGVDVCAETTLIVTNAPQNFVWEGYGFKLGIPEDCLPPGIDQCTVNIKASVSGQYKFPDNTHPVSPIFWLQCEPRCKFTLPILVEVQHCGKSKDVSKLSLVKACCSQVDLPYSFKQLQGNRFYDEGSSSYGATELTSFSGVGVAQDELEDKEYVARLFYLHQKMSAHIIHFVVTWNNETHMTVVSDKYKSDHFKSGSADQLVEFESEEIKLDVPFEGTTLKEGWKISPLNEPEITKRYIDRYKPGKMIPYCSLSADFDRKGGEIPLLYCSMGVIGARKPRRIAIKPPPPPSPSPPPPITSSHAGMKRRKFAKGSERFRKRIMSAVEVRDIQKLSCGKKSASFGDVEQVQVIEEIGEPEEPARKKRKIIVEITESTNKPQHGMEEEMEERDGPQINSAEMTAQPSLGNLRLIVWLDKEGKQQHFRLQELICDKWILIGDLLHIPYPLLDAWKNTLGNPMDCIRQVLTRWLESSNDTSPIYPVSWEGLYELLDDAELTNIVASLKEAIENAQSCSAQAIQRVSQGADSMSQSNGVYLSWSSTVSGNINDSNSDDESLSDSVSSVEKDSARPSPASKPAAGSKLVPINIAESSFLVQEVTASLDEHPHTSSPTPSLDATPTLAKLSVLKNNGKKVKIIKDMAPHWRDLGAIMDFDKNGTELANIHSRHRGDPEECCRAVFQHWMSGNGVRPCSWRRLIELIDDCGQVTLAEDIQSVLSSSSAI